MDEGKGAYWILMGRPEGSTHLEDPGVDWMIVLKWIFKKWDGGMDWIDTAQDRDRWRALVIYKIRFLAHKEHSFSIRNANRLMLFRGTVGVYCAIDTKQINALW
jgi:hypothetical protein